MHQDTLELMADYMKTLAQPTRLKVLFSLKEGEQCVCDIVEAMGEEQPNVSRHLGVLRRSGVVKCRKEGVQAFYSVADPLLFALLGDVQGLIRRRIEKRLSSMGRAAIIEMEGRRGS